MIEVGSVRAVFSRGGSSPCAASPAVTAAALALSPPGCRRTTNVTIDQTGGKVLATIDMPQDACVADLDVTDCAPVTRRTVFRHVGLARADRGVARLTLGQVPPGYTGTAARAPLVPGRRYPVVVTGSGFAGDADFVIDSATGMLW